MGRCFADVLLDDFLVAENAVSQSEVSSSSPTPERASSLTGPRMNQPSLSMSTPIPIPDGRHEQSVSGSGGVRYELLP